MFILEHCEPGSPYPLPRYWQFIYRLSDPRDGKVRYIGCCSNPYYCERRHRSLPAKREQPKVKAWIRELRELGLKPQFKILTKIPSNDSHRIETAYIRSYEEAAPGQLLNTFQKVSCEEGNLRTRLKRKRYSDARKKPTPS